MNTAEFELGLVVPVYNEEEAIGQVLTEWCGLLDHMGMRYQIYAYNDGSKDGTAQVLNDAAVAHPGKVVAINKDNEGHGPTILRGYRDASARCQWIFQMDSDNEMGSATFPKLWEARAEKDFLLGQRDGRQQPLPRKVISWVSRMVVSIFYGKSIWDVNAPYRLMRAEKFAPIYQAIPADTFAPNVIISGFVGRHKMRFQEFEVPHQDRQTGEVSIKKWKLLKAAMRSFKQTICFSFNKV